MHCYKFNKLTIGEIYKIEQNEEKIGRTCRGNSGDDVLYLQHSNCRTLKKQLKKPMCNGGKEYEINHKIAR